ncbi:unnamed protein product [Owenia fusiformis]|uniref:Fork-head domain-containing protein n=1 Tax=Owenia fusiformis TaxID=6347 RepID=A0A8S4PU01_OWEFU|nr:unnamed protein product [Owenia fusiformis]
MAASKQDRNLPASTVPTNELCNMSQANMSNNEEDSILENTSLMNTLFSFGTLSEPGDIKVPLTPICEDIDKINVQKFGFQNDLQQPIQPQLTYHGYPGYSFVPVMPSIPAHSPPDFDCYKEYHPVPLQLPSPSQIPIPSSIRPTYASLQRVPKQEKIQAGAPGLVCNPYATPGFNPYRPKYYPHLMSCLSPPTSPTGNICDSYLGGVVSLYDDRTLSTSPIPHDRSDCVVPNQSLNETTNSLNSTYGPVDSTYSSLDNTSSTLNSTRSNISFNSSTSSCQNSTQFQPVRPWIINDAPRDAKRPQTVAPKVPSLTVEKDEHTNRQTSKIRPSRKRKQPDDEKPDVSYIEMITMAILSKPDRKMVLCEIYQYIRDNFSYYDNEVRAWRNSVRHNLSLNEFFIKKGRDGRGNFWAIHPACEELFANGNFNKKLANSLASQQNFHCGTGNKRIKLPHSFHHPNIPIPQHNNNIGYNVHQPPTI